MSATKTPLAAGDCADLVRALGGENATVGAELTGGMFNLAYAVDLGSGASAVLKVAPPPDVPVLTYEHDLMAAELDFFDRTAGLVPVPSVIGRDLERDRPAFLMSWVDGTPLNKTRLPADQRARVRQELGRQVALIGSVTGETFGYLRPDGSFRADTWPEAFGQMWRAILADAAAWRVRLPAPARRIPELLDRATPLLEEVTTPVLTHFDLWDGNVFVSRDPSGTRLSGLIDGERRFWGDPIAELASTSLLRDAEKDVAFLRGFAEAAPSALVFSPSVRARLALYRAYLSTIMLVEAAPRAAHGLEAIAARWLVTRALTRQLRDADEALRASEL